MRPILNFSLLFCTTLLFAQSPSQSTTSLANPKAYNNHLQKGSHSIDTTDERDQYIGLWQYEQDGVLFELKIDKIDKIDKQFSTKTVDYEGKVSYKHNPVVIFKYKLVKNGVTLFDNLNHTVSKKYLSYASQANNYLIGSMMDATANATVVIMIKKLDATNPEKIYFDFKSDFYYLNEAKEKGSRVPFFSIPVNGIEMVKVQ